MICVEFYTEPKGELVGFKISGHNGKAGSDIICAAVSSAAYMAVNTITDIIQADAQVAVEDGYMLVTVSSEKAKACRIVFAGLKLHLLGLEEQYPKNIHVCYMEV